jgi:hypothetical protein
MAFPGKCLTDQQKSSVLHLEMCRGAMVQHWNFHPDGQVTTDVGNCLTVFGGPAPGTRASARWCNGDPGQGWDSAPDRRGARRRAPISVSGHGTLATRVVAPTH